MSPLPSWEKQLLLEVARRSLIQGVQRRASADIFSPTAKSFLSPGAFATLHCRGRLRGCIGQIGAPQPIVPLVAYCARAAALEDPRFRPVKPHEIPEIEIELSILSALEVITYERIEIGKHGLMVTSGSKRGVLLPQVASQYCWDTTRFLEETCLKAGLDRAAWHAEGARIEAFSAEVFSESELCSAVSTALLPPLAE
ncbi:MAG: AmmeMemoRadiSam system protein A [Candidatus Acidiferrales bacterium]